MELFQDSFLQLLRDHDSMSPHDASPSMLRQSPLLENGKSVLGTSFSHPSLRQMSTLPSTGSVRVAEEIVSSVTRNATELHDVKYGGVRHIA